MKNQEYDNQVKGFLKSGKIDFDVNNVSIICAYNSLCQIQCPICNIDFDNIGHVGTDGFNFEHGSDDNVKDNCPANGDDDAIFCNYKEDKFYLETYGKDSPHIDITEKLAGLFIQLFKEYVKQNN